MSYRICYKCGKTRLNLILEYLGVCLWCKIRAKVKRHKKEMKKLIRKQQKEMSDFLSGKKTLKQILNKKK